jgi:dihydrofolate reductase
VVDIPVAAIVAMSGERVIGVSGKLPWNLPEDMAHFRRLTNGGVVLMGRKTWDSLPSKFRPLPGRINLVVSRDAANLDLPEGVLRAASPEQGLERAKLAALKADQAKVWVIGGAEIYRALLPLCDEVHLTVVDGEYVGDAWLPNFEGNFTLVSQERGEACEFRVFSKPL